jgi:hypothetical protein
MTQSPSLYCTCGITIQDGLGEIQNGGVGCPRCACSRCARCMWEHLRKCQPSKFLEFRNNVFLGVMDAYFKPLRRRRVM